MKDALRMHNIGFSVAQIADQLAISNGRVWRVLKDNSAEMNGNKNKMLSANEEKEISDMYLLGYSTPEIAKAKLRSANAVNDALRKKWHKNTISYRKSI